MKKSFLLLPLIAVGAYVTLSSNLTGYPGNRTGSDGVVATTGCGDGTGSCHGSAASTSIQFLPTGAILLDSAGTGTFVTGYTPGKNYVIHIGAANTSTSILPKFGFQLSTVSGSGSSSVQAGTFGTAPSGTAVNTYGGRKIFGHTTPRASSGTGGPGSVDSVSIRWTAPAAGTGTVTMYVVINGVDGDNLPSSNDKWNTATASFAEKADHTGVGSVANAISVKTFPNPVVSSLNLQLTNATAGSYNVQLFDMSGKVISSQKVDVTGNTITAIEMNNCPSGVYQVVVEKNGARSVVPVVKQ